MTLGSKLLLVALAVSFRGCRLHCGSGGASLNYRSSSSSSSRMYVASRAGMSLFYLSVSSAAMFQARAAGGLCADLLVTTGTGAAVGATVG